MINQITIFLENTEGRLAAVTRVLADANINMLALTIADTAEYGLVRIICDKPEDALVALRVADYRAISTPVSAIAVSDEAGGLAKLMEVLDALKLNIEYGYCFSRSAETAIDVLKISNIAEAEEAVAAIEAAGFKVLAAADLA